MTWRTTTFLLFLFVDQSVNAPTLDDTLGTIDFLSPKAKAKFLSGHNTLLLPMDRPVCPQSDIPRHGSNAQQSSRVESEVEQQRASHQQQQEQQSYGSSNVQHVEQIEDDFTVVTVPMSPLEFEIGEAVLPNTVGPHRDRIRQITTAHTQQQQNFYRTRIRNAIATGILGAMVIIVFLIIVIGSNTSQQNRFGNDGLYWQPTEDWPSKPTASLSSSDVMQYLVHYNISSVDSFEPQNISIPMRRRSTNNIDNAEQQLKDNQYDLQLSHAAAVENTTHYFFFPSPQFLATAFMSNSGLASIPPSDVGEFGKFFITKYVLCVIYYSFLLPSIVALHLGEVSPGNDREEFYNDILLSQQQQYASTTSVLDTMGFLSTQFQGYCRWNTQAQGVENNNFILNEDPVRGVICDNSHAAPIGLILSEVLQQQQQDLQQPGVTEVDNNSDANIVYSTIPTEIGLLKSLIVIDIGKNYNLLRGTIPTELCTLPSLQQLFLDSNSISGTLPYCLGVHYNDTAINSSSNTSENLSSNSSSQTAAAVSLKSKNALTTLMVNNNQLSGTIPESYSNLHDMQIMVVHDNNLTGNPFGLVDSWHNLRVLRLSHNQFRGAIDGTTTSDAPLQYMNVTQIDISHNQFTTSPPYHFPTQLLRQFPNLLLLDISVNNFRGDLSRLDDDYVMMNGISGGGANIDFNLLSLAMYGNEFTGTIPKELFQSLSSSSSNEGIKSRFADLIHLDMSNNHFTGTLPETLSQLSMLRILYMANNPFAPSTFPTEIYKLTALSELNLRNTSLVGTLPSISTIGSITNDDDNLPYDTDVLAALYVLDSWDNFTQSMVTLDVSYNDLTGIVDSSFVPSLTQSEMIRLNNNPLLSGDVGNMFGAISTAYNAALASRTAQRHLTVSVQGTSMVGNMSASLCSINANEEVLLPFHAYYVDYYDIVTTTSGGSDDTKISCSCTACTRCVANDGNQDNDSSDNHIAPEKYCPAIPVLHFDDLTTNGRDPRV